MHAQGVRDPAVAFLLAHPAPAGIVEGAARMVVVGTHGESRAVRLGAKEKNVCVFANSYDFQKFVYKAAENVRCKRSADP